MPQRIFKPYTLYIVLALLACLGARPAAQAQWVVQKLPAPPAGTAVQGLQSTTLDTLALPFWEDFSGPQGQPNAQLWFQSPNVTVNRNMGINPPSMGVASFDGLTANGLPYSRTPDEDGIGDSLVSMAINLGNLPIAQEGTVFLSFYWQLKGNGETPDPEDFIRLQFLDLTGQYQTVWEQRGQEGIDTETFNYQSINIAPLYRHGGFRFRFVSSNRLSGNFDNFHIDYIYLDLGRSANEEIFDDFALTQTPTAGISPYRALPFGHFTNGSLDFAAGQFFGFNLEDSLKSVSFRANLNVLNGPQAGSTLQELFNTSVVVAPTAPTTQALAAIDPSTITALDQDSVTLELEVFLQDAADPIVTAADGRILNFRQNDTLRTQFTLSDYYAYDDGTAEFAAGINRAGGRIAVQYIVQQADTLSHIDIYSPALGNDQSSEPVTLKVWTRLDNENRPDFELVSQPIILRKADSLNRFSRYALDRPVIVQDTIYIGWEQNTNTILSLGLDRSNNVASRLFFNTSGQWAGNNTLEGSLMIRPRFARGSIFTGTPESVPALPTNTLFPNPARGLVTVQGNVTLLGAYNQMGQQMPLRTLNSRLAGSQKQKLDIGQWPAGIYFVVLQYKGATQTLRLQVLP